ncbi:MAG: ATP-dependent Clp protease ATP-binding subunit ClpA [Bacillota bacterium]|nr:ATP-dependent Clp protease ATP-binding subunit ClpA [Bacillota bacterium]
MKIDKLLNEVIAAAYSEAKYEKHQYFTPEHILYASLFFSEGKEIIESCGGSIEELKDDLITYFKEHIDIVESEPPLQSVGIQNILSAAGAHVLSAEKESIKLGDIFIAMYDAEECFAGYFLRKQGISKLDILNYITHGMHTMESIEKDDIEDSVEYIDDIEVRKEATNKSQDKNIEDKSSILASFAVDLTEKAKRGEIDPVIGREEILDRTLQVLSRRLKNNPIHVGEPGVGKTAITEALAILIANDKVPKALSNSRIFYLDMGSLLAGTKYRGDFEERIKKILQEIKKQQKPIVYIDEIHTIIGAGATNGGSMDASNILKPFLSDGSIRFIGATTYDEYKKIFEKDRALSRRFQKIDVPEPTTEETLQILLGLKDKYEEYHNVKYSDEALKITAELSSKYISDRFLPDKAIDVIDETGAYVRLHSSSDETICINEKDIEKTISSMAKIPQESVSSNEIEILKSLDDLLKKEIYGQDTAIDTIVQAIKRSRAGFNDESKTVANLLFVGPTGVGKTEITKQLAKVLGIPLIRFDMSEYQEKHTVARLIGAPPGYVGYDEGGLLTDAIRKNPYCVLLLDEIEKVHPDVLNVLLQLMDYATLTDNTGKKADFRNVILIMTSNAGAKEVGKSLLGFGQRVMDEGAISKEVERVFSPEFRNRLDEIVIFNKMDNAMAILVAKKAIRQFEDKLTSKGITISVTDECYNWISERGLSSPYGAREIIRIVQHEIKPYFVDAVLFGNLSNSKTVVIDIKDDKIVII